MINFDTGSGISAIVLSVLLIFYLIIVELGNEKIKKILVPIIIVLIIAFCIIAFQNVYETYRRIK